MVVIVGGRWYIGEDKEVAVSKEQQSKSPTLTAKKEGGLIGGWGGRCEKKGRVIKREWERPWWMWGFTAGTSSESSR